MPRKNLHNFFVLYCILCFISILVSNDEQIIVPKISIHLHLPIINWPMSNKITERCPLGVANSELFHYFNILSKTFFSLLALWSRGSAVNFGSKGPWSKP